MINTWYSLNVSLMAVRWSECLFPRVCSVCVCVCMQSRYVFEKISDNEAPSDSDEILLLETLTLHQEGLVALLHLALWLKVVDRFCVVTMSRQCFSI